MARTYKRKTEKYHNGSSERVINKMWANGVTDLEAILFCGASNATTPVKRWKMGWPSLAKFVVSSKISATQAVARLNEIGFQVTMPNLGEQSKTHQEWIDNCEVTLYSINKEALEQERAKKQGKAMEEEYQKAMQAYKLYLAVEK